MSGILEQLMGKMDTMIANLSEYNDTNRQLLELLKAGKGGAATGDGAVVENKPATTGRGRAKAAEPKAESGPKTTEAALKAKFDELKSTDTEARMPKLKKVISDAGFANLKELLGAPAKFDEAMAALEALETEFNATPAAAEDDDDL